MIRLSYRAIYILSMAEQLLVSKEANFEGHDD